jgi:hypothetical protein
MLSKYTEFYFAIAQYVGVWRSSGPVLVEKILKNPVTVRTGEIYMVQRDLQVVTYLPRILEVIRCCTVAVVVFPIGHVQRVHIGTALLQQYRGYSGIHTAGKTENDAFAADVCSCIHRCDYDLLFMGTVTLITAAPLTR